MIKLYAYNVRFLGITLPDLFPQDSARVEVGRNLYFWLAYTFTAFIVLYGIDTNSCKLCTQLRDDMK